MKFLLAIYLSSPKRMPEIIANFMEGQKAARKFRNELSKIKKPEFASNVNAPANS